MGRGSYTASDWSKLKNSRNITADASASQLFQKNSVDERFDPRFVNVRESCDSEDSPEATPIIIGFDVTGSMGYLAEELAKCYELPQEEMRGDVDAFLAQLEKNGITFR